METKGHVKPKIVDEVKESKPVKEKKATPLPRPIMLQSKPFGDGQGSIIIRVAIDEKRHEKLYYRVTSRKGASIKLEDQPYKTRTIACPFNIDGKRLDDTFAVFNHLKEHGYGPAMGFKTPT